MTDSYTSIWCTYTENSTDKENNTSNVTITLECTSSGWADDSPDYWLKVNGNVVASGTRNFGNGSFQLCSWTGNVLHNIDGTGTVTYQGYFQGTAKPNPGNTTSVYSQNFTTIQRNSVFGTVGNINVEGSVSFPIVKYVNSAKDTLSIKNGSTTIKTINDYTNNQSFTFNSSEKNAIYALNTTGTVVPLNLILTTTSGTQTLGSDSKNINGTFIATSPTFSGSITTSPTTVIEGHQSVNVTISTAAVGTKAAGISQYVVSLGSATITSSSYTGTFTFSNVKDSTVSLDVIDTRGKHLATPATQSIIVLPYSAPTFTAVLSRTPTPVSTSVQMVINGTYATAVASSVTAKYRYKQVGGSFGAYATISLVKSSGNFSYTATLSSTFNMMNSYEFEIVVEDTYSTVTKTIILSSGKATVDIDVVNNRVGIGKFLETEDNDSLSVKGDIYEDGSKLADKYTAYEVVASSTTSGVALAGVSVTTTGDANIGGDIYEGGTKLLDKYGNFYKSGDTETIVSTTSGEKYALMLPGLLTNSKTWMCFTINTSKNMANVTPSITSLKINPRHSGGGYVIGSSYVSGGFQVVGTSGYTIELHKTNNYCIAVTITHSTYNGTNNTPCMIEVDNLELLYS